MDPLFVDSFVFGRFFIFFESFFRGECLTFDLNSPSIVDFPPPDFFNSKVTSAPGGLTNWSSISSLSLANYKKIEWPISDPLSDPLPPSIPCPREIGGCF